MLVPFSYPVLTLFRLRTGFFFQPQPSPSLRNLGPESLGNWTFALSQASRPRAPYLSR
jgi:hypothetical protein